MLSLLIFSRNLIFGISPKSIQLPNYADIPVSEQPTLLVNGRHMDDWGWTEAISVGSSSGNLHIFLDTFHEITNGFSEDIEVYDNSAPDIYYFDELDAYNGIFSLTRSETKYNEFTDRYRGYFNCSYEFVDNCLESEEAYNNLPGFIQTSIDREYLYNIYMNDFRELNGYYFWDN